MADPDEIWAALTPQQKETLVIAGAVFLADPELAKLQRSPQVGKSPQIKEEQKKQEQPKKSTAKSPAAKPFKSERSTRGSESATKSEVRVFGKA